MASDDPKAEGFASRPSRTPPTLDLKAEEVATAPGATGPAKEAGVKAAGAPEAGTDPKASGADAKPGDAKPGDTKPGDTKPGDIKSSGTPPTGPKLSDAKPSDPKSTEPKPSESKASESKPSEAKPAGSKPAEAAASGTGESVASPDAGAAKSPSGGSAPAAVPAPARSGGGAVFAGLIAGLIGGGAVAGGLWYALPQFFPPPAPVAAPAPAVDLSPLQSRIAALEARPAFDPRAIAALSERLERGEATLKALEGTVAALKSAPAPTAAPAAAAPAPAPAVPAALAKTVDELKVGSEATGQALAAARRDIEALRSAETSLQTAVAAAAAGAQQAGAQAQSLAQTLTPKVEAVGPRLDALKKQIEEATAAATAFNRAAAGLVVLSTFRDAVASGRPFAVELAAARTTLGPAAGQLDPFAAAATEGFASPAKLAAKLAQEGAAAIGATRPAAPAPSSTSLVDRLMASAESLVKVRPAAGPGSVDSEGLVATAVGQVTAGQLDDALVTLKKLPEPVQARLAVIREIEARTAAVRVAGTLYQQQLAAISGKAP
ncbi:hypothetical protein K9U40_16215 [Xanthobacter autotrophicus]|uniref:COG4223 family protein n=1 Tax=Xanthobacter autotrophicus TaxID=280 RepID=UPI0024ABF58E|nr:hypothetical protein [Xanthobacter autotrophicus]MDI4665856.1 hypothetical protein [Xanthobacter autotrophicus]